jgi:hypothetical protein
VVREEVAAVEVGAFFQANNQANLNEPFPDQVLSL